MRGEDKVSNCKEEVVKVHFMLSSGVLKQCCSPIWLHRRHNVGARSKQSSSGYYSTDEGDL